MAQLPLMELGQTFKYDALFWLIERNTQHIDRFVYNRVPSKTFRDFYAKKEVLEAPNRGKAHWKPNKKDYTQK